MSAQLSLTINELHLSNVKVDINRNIIDEDLKDGPYLQFVCFFENHTDSSVILYPSKSRTNVVFRYMGENYRLEVIPLPFVDRDLIKLNPNQGYNMSFGISLFLGTPILKENQMDYTKEMLLVLPTVNVNYKDCVNNMRTSDILNVTIR